jgi:photosystem II stability/assembly factor-like uncharacterized protein
MKNLYFLAFICLVGACTKPTNPRIHLPEVFEPQVRSFPINSSIRALEVINDSTVWFAGSRGVFGHTTNGGKHWIVDSISIDGALPDFRSISVTSEAVFLLNAGSPAYLLKSTDRGENWRQVYTETHPGTFFDCLRFGDDQNGMAMGDPIDSCLVIIVTIDQGETWTRLPCSQLPKTVAGEAAFAASNTNIALFGDHVWMGTGGTKARVFHSGDGGSSWRVFQTPIQQGGAMTGIFSIDFYDDRMGIVFGGNWEAKSDNHASKAITHDGGKTWSLLSVGEGPGYRSCVQYVQGSEGLGILAVGSTGISFSNDGGLSWQEHEIANFYTVGIAPSGRVAWLAGRDKLAVMRY